MPVCALHFKPSSSIAEIPSLQDEARTMWRFQSATTPPAVPQWQTPSVRAAPVPKPARHASLCYSRQSCPVTWPPVTSPLAVGAGDDAAGDPEGRVAAAAALHLACRPPLPKPHAAGAPLTRHCRWLFTLSTRMQPDLLTLLPTPHRLLDAAPMLAASVHPDAP